MNKFLVAASSIVLIVALKDSYIFFNSNNSFDDLAVFNLYIEAGYYYFGIALGFLATLSKSSGVKFFVLFTATVSLIVTVYSVSMPYIEEDRKAMDEVNISI